MKIKVNQLLSELKTMTENNIKAVETLLSQSNENLNTRKSENSWTVLECLEHLNFYGKFYLPEIENRIRKSQFPSKSPDFKAGIVGNYFTDMMRPKEKLKKMKTLKTANPIHKLLDKSVIAEFIGQQHTMLQLLEKAKTIDLEKTKTSISISKLIKLKLGDTFRFVIYHNWRHVRQAENILSIISLKD